MKIVKSKLDTRLRSDMAGVMGYIQCVASQTRILRIQFWSVYNQIHTQLRNNIYRSL